MIILQVVHKVAFLDVLALASIFEKLMALSLIGPSFQRHDVYVRHTSHRWSLQEATVRQLNHSWPIGTYNVHFVVVVVDSIDCSSEEIRRNTSAQQQSFGGGEVHLVLYVRTW